ncbi:MAG: hypothetical protein F4W91_19745 [Gemmatimonadetes bacterium]|nr:hypothetical protein [Gemmatimonadota bacterium]
MSRVLVVFALLVFVTPPSSADPPRLYLDTLIEIPAYNNNLQEVTEKQPGDIIKFQIFAPDAAGHKSHGYVVELALPGKAFDSYIGDINGIGWTEKNMRFARARSGNPTLAMLSLASVTIPENGYLGEITLNVAHPLTSDIVLIIQAAAWANGDGIQDMDASDAAISFMETPLFPGDFDGNGIVNMTDFLFFVAAFDTRSGDAKYNVLADLNRNGTVDMFDFLLFVTAFGGS